MRNNAYNNLGIGIISIASVMNVIKSLSVDKVFLIIPFFTHQELLAFLSNSRSEIRSIEQVMAHKINCFSNYSKRYFDNLVLTLNSIQYLIDMEYVDFKNGKLLLKNELQFNSRMGKRASKIYKSANNVSKLLSDNSYNLYLNLKVKI